MVQQLEPCCNADQEAMPAILEIYPVQNGNAHLTREINDHRPPQITTLLGKVKQNESVGF